MVSWSFLIVAPRFESNLARHVQKYVGMSPPEYRVALIRILAEIDQQVCKAEDWAYHPDLSRETRQIAVVQLEFRRRAAIHVEGMLAAFDERRVTGRGETESS